MNDRAMTTDHPGPLHVTLENFEGPLQVLLDLVESQKLEIEHVSLAAVTDQFLKLLEERQAAIPMETLADFLVVAAKLMYMKSRMFLPPEALPPAEETGIPLEEQLRIFQRYAEASKTVADLFASGRRSFSRARVLCIESRPIRIELPENVSTGSLYLACLKLLERLSQYRTEAVQNVKRVVSIKEKILHLKELIADQIETRFHTLVGTGGDRTDIVVHFLALLELVKQRFIILEQETLFDEITIRKITS